MGAALCRVWLPAAEAFERVPADRLRPVAEAEGAGRAWMTYAASAARVADALAQDALLAPIESQVIPLPYQIRALARAAAGGHVRYLLADEVGLGKTVEAGLIMRELKLRGSVRRTLVVAPKGLVNQWVAEMRTHFGEEFRAMTPSDFPAFRRIAPADNVWRTCDQVVCPMDAVKPLDVRRGWSRERVAEHNRDRFEDLTAAGWDLVIIDEAHRLGGSTDQVARHQLGRGLADAAPSLLLLSATPHQGKTDAFHRLMSLVDETAFPDAGDLTGERVQPFVIRTEKRQAIDADGQPLFKPRHTRMEPIAYEERHAGQRALYEAVTEYARDGYNRALREHQGHLGFLMILMQRLVTSSTRAIRVTLERRLAAIDAPDDQLLLFPELTDEEWADSDGQERIDTLLTSRLHALKNERAEVELLLEAARRTERAGADAKAEAVRGLWSLWQITLRAPEQDRRRLLPLFRHDDGRVLAPTARFTWERLLAGAPAAGRCLDGDAAAAAFAAVDQAAREHGRPVYGELVHAHHAEIAAPPRAGRLLLRRSAPRHRAAGAAGGARPSPGATRRRGADVARRARPRRRSQPRLGAGDRAPRRGNARRMTSGRKAARLLYAPES